MPDRSNPRPYPIVRDLKSTLSTITPFSIQGVVTAPPVDASSGEKGPGRLAAAGRAQRSSASRTSYCQARASPRKVDRRARRRAGTFFSLHPEFSRAVSASARGLGTRGPGVRGIKKKCRSRRTARQLTCKRNRRRGYRGRALLASASARAGTYAAIELYYSGSHPIHFAVIRFFRFLLFLDIYLRDTTWT
jgi:hypothetical protein